MNVVKHNVLVVLNNIDRMRMVDKAVNTIVDWVFKVTNGKLILSIDWKIINEKFKTVGSNVRVGINDIQKRTTVIDTNQIYEIGKGEQYDTVCLIYNPENIVGERPKFSVHVPDYKHGFTTIQIPIWKTHDTYTLTLTFIHELLHAWYFLIRQRARIYLKDEVHIHSTFDDPRPKANYSDIVYKMKPYWAYLSQKSMLYHITINGRRIVARREMIDKLLQVHELLFENEVYVWSGFKKIYGLVIGSVETSSWRSLATQIKLVSEGKSKTINSNHRRGTAIDVYPSHSYIKKISTYMRSFGLVNDLDFDPNHFNLGSNREASEYGIIDVDESISYRKDEELYNRLIGKLVQRVEANGEIYKVTNTHIEYVPNYAPSPLFDEMSRRLQKSGELVGLTEESWSKISDALNV